MTTPTQNKFKSTTVYGAFINDDYPDATVLADATFKNNITTTGDLTMNGKTDVSTINNPTNTVTTTQKLFGDIILNGGDITLNSGVTTVVTKNLAGSTLSTVNTSVSGGLNCQLINNYGILNQWKGGNLKLYDTSNLAHSLIYTSSGILNIRTYNVATYPVLFYCTKLQHSPNNGVNTYDVLTTQPAVISAALSNYALLASPTFTGVPLAPTATLTDSSTQIATTNFVKSQGYLTSVSTAYAPTINPAAGANNYASITAIASTYQPIASMSSYLTTTLASTTYQTKAAMSTYAPLSNPSFTGTVNVSVLNSSGNISVKSTTVTGDLSVSINIDCLGSITAAEYLSSKYLVSTEGIIELGKVGNSISRIDMKSTNGDYDVRLYQSGGSSTLAGQGQLNIEASGGVNFFSMPSTSVAPTSGNHLCNKTYVDSITTGSSNNQFSKAKILI